MTTTTSIPNCAICGNQLNLTLSGWKCHKCAGISPDNFKISDFLMPERDKGTFGITGWICPVCGRGCSPYTSYCDCNNDRSSLNTFNFCNYGGKVSNSDEDIQFGPATTSGSNSST